MKKNIKLLLIGLPLIILGFLVWVKLGNVWQPPLTYFDILAKEIDTLGIVLLFYFLISHFILALTYLKNKRDWGESRGGEVAFFILLIIIIPILGIIITNKSIRT